MLQSCRKYGRPLQRYFISSTIENDYTSDLELIFSSKVRSISDPCTIQAPLYTPQGFSAKHQVQDVDLRSKTVDLLKNIDLESVDDLI